MWSLVTPDAKIQVIRLNTDMNPQVLKQSATWTFFRKKSPITGQIHSNSVPNSQLKFLLFTNLEKGKFGLWLLRSSHSNSRNIFGTPIKSNE